MNNTKKAYLRLLKSDYGFNYSDFGISDADNIKDLSAFKDFILSEYGIYSAYDNITQENKRLQEGIKDTRKKIKCLKKIKSNRLRFYINPIISDFQNIVSDFTTI